MSDTASKARKARKVDGKAVSDRGIGPDDRVATVWAGDLLGGITRPTLSTGTTAARLNAIEAALRDLGLAD